MMMMMMMSNELGGALGEAVANTIYIKRGREMIGVVWCGVVLGPSHTFIACAMGTVCRWDPYLSIMAITSILLL